MPVDVDVVVVEDKVVDGNDTLAAVVAALVASEASAECAAAKPSIATHANNARRRRAIDRKLIFAVRTPTLECDSVVGLRLFVAPRGSHWQLRAGWVALVNQLAACVRRWSRL